MEKGICNLCENERELAESHIIPKFVFRWMKNTGGKYFRTILNPNKRLQDGIKKHLLCNECEQKFSKYEKLFADNIFFPYLNNSARFLEYDEFLGNFIISVLWRTLLLRKIEGEEYYKEVFYDWKSFLDQKTKLKYDKIHLLLLDNNWEDNKQPNEFVQRYFNRVTDTSIMQIDNNTLVFAKFSRFILFAELNNKGNNFRGTNIIFKKSRIPFAQFIDNGKISIFFIKRAEQIYKYVLNNISETEKAKISNEIKKAPQSFWNSDLGLTVASDFESEKVSFVPNEKFRYVCDCCLNPMEEPDGFLLRTFEIIKSKEYWEYAFSENGFGITEPDLEKRLDYFKEMSSSQTPWIICDNCISKFDINKKESEIMMKEWIMNKGKYKPPKSDDFRKYLVKKEIDEIGYNIATVNNKN